LNFWEEKTYIAGYGGMWLSEYSEIQREKREMGMRSKCYRICANAFGCNEKKVITERMAFPNSFMQ